MKRFPVRWSPRGAVVAGISVALVLTTEFGMAQQTDETALLSERGPRFFLSAAPTKLMRLDAAHTEMLRRRVALSARQASLRSVLDDLARQAGLSLIYSPDIVRLDRTVTVEAKSLTVAAALTEVLLDDGLDVVLSPNGQMSLVARPPAPPLGALAGHVTDAATHAPVERAAVTVAGTNLGSFTDADGRYAIQGVPAGDREVGVRRIGYEPVSRTVRVMDAETATADFALVKLATLLSAVVTTGTVVPTELKARPSPTTVISESAISQQRPQTIQALLRQAVPTAVSWDYPSLPYLTSFSVRGSSGLATGVAQMKVFVDGVEVANPAVAPVDPNSIARVEVVRGPQASSIYGSDAIGGVMQIFTKRGDSSRTQPQIEGQVALGTIQTPYGGYGTVPRRTYSASVTGSSGAGGYNLGAGYSSTGDFLPDGQVSKQSNPSLFGGAHFKTGMVTADLSGRYFTNNFGQVFNPALMQTGFVAYSKPLYTQAELSDQTVGANIQLAPTSWWRSTVSMGFDRSFLSAKRTQQRRTTPADTLLSLVEQTRTKGSVGLNSSLQGRIRESLGGSLAAGFDHWDLQFTQFVAPGALTTSGTLRTVFPTSYSRTLTTNTGVFAQGQLSFHDRLFATAGVRGEHNSDFGDSLGTPISPQMGLSYVQPMGASLLKVRGSWGRAIKAPAPNRKLAVPTGTSIFLANPNLAPERQHGWDAGLDAEFTDGSLSLSYYDQTADNLIQPVVVESSPTRVSQYQNVGKVKNNGLEIEGTWTAGPIQLRGQYGYSRARIETLGSTYVGDLMVGDQALGTPKQTGGASLSTMVFARTSLTAGVTYVGSWTNYDNIALYACLAKTGPCRTTNRDYIVPYPGFAKVNLALTREFSARLSGFLSVDNLTNNESYELTNDNPVMGRITSIGIKLRN